MARRRTAAGLHRAAPGPGGSGVWGRSVVVTFAVHFPLNDELIKAGDPARIENLAAVRDDFVTPWVAWDIVRTLASTAAFASFAWALVLRGRMGRAEQPQRTEGHVCG